MTRFLKCAEPEVLCIRGAWGVGKTYTWTKQIEDAQTSGAIGLPRYSYVSLFGLNSLDDMKASIFENVITVSNGITKADLASLDKFVNSNLGSWRRLSRFAQAVPLDKELVGESPALLSFLTIRNQIVCFDDLERKGKNLEIEDVLGLISFLREQRDCKVVLILNDEALGEAKETFDKHLEKVVDVSLVYAPTSSDCVAVALKGEDHLTRRIAERCTVLGISNIRVIRKIERFVRLIQPLLLKFDEGVLNQALSGLALFCWSHDQPEVAPPLKFLTTNKAKNVFGSVKAEELSEKEAAWNALLAAYDYYWTDEFDLVLINGVRNGYFDPAEVEKHAQELHDKIIASRADGSFEEAWKTYHNSFANNQDEVLDTIYKSFMTNLKYVTPVNLNGTVTLFKDLGRQEQAAEMIKHYVEKREENAAFFDLDQIPFAEDITDADVREAFKAKCAKLNKEDAPDVFVMLLKLQKGFEAKNLSALASAPVEEYYEAFKAASGRELRSMVSDALQFARIVNATHEMKEISVKARAALKIIGEESPINARRVAKYGIVVDGQVEQPSAP